MDKFLEIYSLTKINQVESWNMNRQITHNEIEAVINKLPTNKSPELDGFIHEIYQTFWEPTPVLFNLFYKFQEKGQLLNSPHEAALS